MKKNILLISISFIASAFTMNNHAQKQNTYQKHPERDITKYKDLTEQQMKIIAYAIKQGVSPTNALQMAYALYPKNK